ncbi:hypothetical protein CEUSTIGMA_g2672.t1 [Chlamydomonas eustigma]|uniref:Cytochrome b561 domain-containing protein n=1 Tax=Chlamydomonas eustigma TaxID=1157962 RepID=A0A250WWL4_9CHLO|nr:hypothetical protein CEUSTIGMA_g2672.t1 [Chlamydomonas eustigma]|eukprot:GAX75228.1 hypothetical protein CEUSTIGMA_g2672.t1 [Chlamydomonas eustigma]
MKNVFSRVALTLLPRMAWVTFLVLIIVWVMKVEGGMGFVATNVFGWHAVLMSAAFGVFMPEALLSFEAPMLPVSLMTSSPQIRRTISKSWHVFCHMGTMICSVLGIVSIYYYKSLTIKTIGDFTSPLSQPPGPPPMVPMSMPDYPPSFPPTPPAYFNYFPYYTLFSPHAWIGVAVLCAWLLQLTGGVISAIIPDMSAETKDMIRKLHRFWGRCVFATGLATCAMGLQDMQSSDLAAGADLGSVGGYALPYSPTGLFAQLSTAATLMAAAVGILTFAAIEFYPSLSGPTEKAEQLYHADVSAELGNIPKDRDELYMPSKVEGLPSNKL